MKKLLLAFVAAFVTFSLAGQCPHAYHVSIVNPCMINPVDTVKLDTSEYGVNYQLYWNSTARGGAISGTGLSIAWPVATGDSFFYVVGTRSSSGCSTMMHDSVRAIYGEPDTLQLARTFYCPGDSIFALETITGGTWSVSNPSIASIEFVSTFRVPGTQAELSVLSTGTATISYTMSTSCGTHSVTKNVHVVSGTGTITITGPSDLCLNAPVQYFTSDTMGLGTWGYGHRVSAAISATGTFTAFTPGNDSISYNVGGACTPYQSRLHIVARTLASSSTIIGSPALILGDTTTLYTTSTSPVWSISPSAIDSISPSGLVTTFDTGNSLVFCSHDTTCNARQLPVLPVGSHISDSFCTSIYNLCGHSQFSCYLFPVSAGYHLQTFYGDGTTDYFAVGDTVTYNYFTFNHTYAAAGSYSVKHRLYSGTTLIDSIVYTYNYLPCNETHVSAYFDMNNDCIFDTGDYRLGFPINIIVDSNGYILDTFSAITGLFYSERGAVGDVYGFRVWSPYTRISCPSSGIVYDTVTASGHSAMTSLALNFIDSTHFDLQAKATVRTGRHLNYGTILVTNPFYHATGATVTLKYDARYPYDSASPSPTAYTDSTITWNISSVSGSDTPIVLNYNLSITSGYSSWLTPGTLVPTQIAVTPTTGDIDSTNNFINRVDTAIASWDPNYCSVTPDGDILNGTQLQYAIHFENDGNDTAQNIYVMDTLSENLDIRTFRLEAATATMDVEYIPYGTQNIVKFSFPHIKLPDSSHHGQCTGAVLFRIRTKFGITDRTNIYNRAGIYFDDNEVVMTNSAHNRITAQTLTIGAPTDTICPGSSLHFTAHPNLTGDHHFHWFVNTGSVGSDSIGFMALSLAAGDSVKCFMTTYDGDTVTTVSNVITIYGYPSYTGSISGPSSTCSGTPQLYTASITTGAWHVSNHRASISATGTFTGSTSGLDTVIYNTYNTCDTTTTFLPVTILAVPVAGTITGPVAMCPGATITLVDTVVGGSWTLTNGLATHIGSLVTGVTPGTDTAIFTVTNTCGTAHTTHPFAVLTPVTPSVSITAGPHDSVCAGDTITYTATPVNGGSTPTYYWTRFGTVIGTGNVLHYIPTYGDIVQCNMMSDATCPSADTVTSNSILIYVYTIVTPNDSISVTGGDSIFFLGQMVTFNSDVSYCGTATRYQWFLNRHAVPGATNNTYATNVYGNDTVYCHIRCDAPCTTSNGDTSNVIVIYGDYLIPNGIGNIAKLSQSLTMVPNPNKGVFTLAGPLNTPNNIAPTCQIMDMTGKIIFSAELRPVNGYLQEELHLDDDEHLASGQYMIRIVSDKGVQVLHFVLQK